MSGKTKQTHRCWACGDEQETPRIPRGWKKTAGGLLCKSCRGTESRNFVYGITLSKNRPMANEQTALEQVRLAHRYRDDLTKAELDRRAAADETLCQLRPDLAAMTKQAAALVGDIDEARRELNKRKSDARSRRVQCPERDRLKEFQSQLRELRAKIKAARTEAFAAPDVRVMLDGVEDAHAKRLKKMRSESGLYWANYLVIEAAMRGARRGAPPTFRRFDGGGKVAVQLQGGLTVADALAGCDTRFRLEVQRTMPNGRQYASASVRVGTQEDGRAPVFATAPVVLHRPLPEKGVIKWAFGEARRVASHRRWKLRITVESRRDSWARAGAARGGAVAIDVGWRMVDGGLRVAYWIGDDGREGEWVIAHRDLSRWSKVDELRSIRDHMLDDAKELLASWTDQHGEPGWMVEWRQGRDLGPVRLWRSAANLALLVHEWRQHLDGPDGNGAAEMHRQLEGWRVENGTRKNGKPRYSYGGWQKQDKHLWEWECHARAKALAWRDDLYRRLVADLRQKYRTAAIEKVDWSKLQEQPGDMDVKGQEVVRTYRRIAAVGRLVALVNEGFAAHSTVGPEHTTRQCADCGHRQDVGGERVVTCEQCGGKEDQDRRAARNLLAGFAAGAAGDAAAARA